MDEAMKKRIDERAQEILDNRRQSTERALRLLAERIAYREIALEQRAAREAAEARLASE